MSETPNTNDAAASRVLIDNFLVDNEDLHALNAKISSFNIFSVLRVDNAEIRHSNVLAWLLDPNESHGLGALFLRRFIARVLLENQSSSLSLTPSRVELMSFRNVTVLREWQNIDVLARSDSDSERWCLLIENKIHSDEINGQLERYLGAARQEMPDHDIIPIYLTLQGDDPSEDGQELGFIPVSHGDVLDLVEKTVNQNSKRIPDDAKTFIDHYVQTLRRLTMQDDELANLCKAIYRKHSKAIDMIYLNGKATNFWQVCAKTIESEFEDVLVKDRKNDVYFLPSSIAVAFPESDWIKPPMAGPIECSFWEPDSGRVRAAIEVGPIPDVQTRDQLLHSLRSKCNEFRINESAFGKRGQTRIASFTETISAGRDHSECSDEEIQAITKKLLSQLRPEIDKVAEVLSGFDWG